MKDSFLQKYIGRGEDTPAEPVPASEEVEVAVGCPFGWMRGLRERAVMLELRRKTGVIRAVGYNWINKIDFDASTGITLHAGNDIIRIKGRNLNSDARPHVKLFEGLTRQKVSFIQEADQPDTLQADKKAVVVESIEW